MEGMLEGYADHRGVSRRWSGWVGPAAFLSVVAHIGALVALLVTASWRIEKLEFTGRTVLLAAGVGAPLPQAEEEARPAPKPKPTRRLRRAHDLAQPDPQPPELAPERKPARETGQIADAGSEGLKLFGSCDSGGECTPNGLAALELDVPVCGNGRVEYGEQCDDGGLVNRDGCSALCASEQRMVDNRIIEGYRIAGDPQIHAPQEVRVQMAERGATATLGAVKMCLREDGGVLSLRLLRSTGYPAYDRLLTASMQGWRYRPYQLADGTNVMACTVVTFIYRMTIRHMAASRIR
jgi:cysteine-rich repeat protein